MPAESQPRQIRDEKHAVALCLQQPVSERNGRNAHQARLAVPVHGFAGSWKRVQPFRTRYPQRPLVRTSIYRDGPAQLPPGHALYQLRCRSKSHRAAVAKVALARRRLLTKHCEEKQLDALAGQRPSKRSHSPVTGLEHTKSAKSQPNHDAKTNAESCFLMEKIGHFKTVQLRYSRRSLVRPAVVGCASPIKLYYVAFGGRPLDGTPGGVAQSVTVNHSTR